jgi:hypothetical protein
MGLSDIKKVKNPALPDCVLVLKRDQIISSRPTRISDNYMRLRMD